MKAARVINIGQPRAPQVEDGYTRIANELFDAILGARLSSQELNVMMAVIRKTYGYNKKQDDISASQIGALCGIERTHVTATLKKLEAKQMIHKRAGTFGCVIGIQKDYSRWVVEHKKGRTESVLGQNQSPSRAELVLVDRPESVHTKDNLPKDNQQKTTPWSPQASTAAFDSFWNAYPKKTKKEKALAAFRELNPDPVLLKRILASIAEHEMTDQWQRGVIEQADTFLIDKLWTDELRIDYNDEQLHVMQTFNELLGPICGDVIDDVFRPNLADAIDVFVGFERDLPPKDGMDFCQRYFGYVAARCVLDNRPYVNFEWLIKRDNFGKVLARELEK